MNEILDWIMNHGDVSVTLEMSIKADCICVKMTRRKDGCSINRVMPLSMSDYLIVLLREMYYIINVCLPNHNGDSDR